MSNEQLLTFFKNNIEIFSNNNIIEMGFRWTGWQILKGLLWVASKCQDLYNISFGLIDFTASSGLNTFIESFKPVLIALMALSIFALGVILILNHEKKPKIIINICIAVLIVTSSTTVFVQLNGLAKDFKAGVETIEIGGQKFDSVYSAISDNLIDILYLDKQLGMKNINHKKNEATLPRPKINKDNFAYINYTEVLNPKSNYKYNEKGEADEILTKRLLPLNDGGSFDSFEIVDLYNGFGWNDSDDTDLANEFYYRYQFDFIPAILTLISIIVLYVAMSYKCIRIVYELAISRMLAFLYAAELSGGQKIAKILVFLRDTYILLLVTVVCIKLFWIFNSFLTASVSNDLVRSLLILFAAFCVIDGPNLVEKLLGMDAGLSSSTARMMAMLGVGVGAAKFGVGAVKFGANSAGKITDKMTKPDFSKGSENKGGSSSSGGIGEKMNEREKGEESKNNGSKDGQKKNNSNTEKNNDFMNKDDKKGNETERFMDKDDEKNNFGSNDFMNNEEKSEEKGLNVSNGADQETSFMSEKKGNIRESSFSSYQEKKPKVKSNIYENNMKGEKK